MLYHICMCRSELTTNYVRMLRDSEAEVRVAAAGKVAAFSKFLTPPQIVRDIIPCVRELSMDSRCGWLAPHQGVDVGLHTGALGSTTACTRRSMHSWHEWSHAWAIAVSAWPFRPIMI